MLFARAVPQGLAVAWVVAPDDARALAEHLGLGHLSTESLDEQPAFIDYLTPRLRMTADGRACASTGIEVSPAPTGFSVEDVLDCGGRPRRIEITSRLLLDIDERYQTLYAITTATGVARGALTASAPSARVDLRGEPIAQPPPEEEPEGLLARITASVQGQAGASPFVIALILAFAVGALHAITPGHGKTLTAAYLIGSGGTIRHALGLGAVVAVTHALAVGALGAVAIGADRLLLPAEVGPWLEIGAGALILGLAWTLARPRRAHEHGSTPLGPLPFRRLAAIGIVGGLVPSPDAIGVVLIAFSLERWTAGAAMIAAFSLGLAAVVLGIAVVAVRGAPLLRRVGGGRFTAVLPRVVAAVFVLMGTLVLVNGVRKL